MRAKQNISVFLIAAMLCSNTGILPVLAETGNGIAVEAGHRTGEAGAETASGSDYVPDEEADDDDDVASPSDTDEIELEFDLEEELEEELATASDALPVMLYAAEAADGTLIYEAEKYYTPLTNSDTCADLQPGEEFEFSVNDAADFSDGDYKLSFQGCGPRPQMQVKVNGNLIGTTNVETSGWGDMRIGTMDEVLSLQSGDKITICAPADGQVGWVDYIALEPYVDIPLMVEGQVLQAEDGNIAEFIGNSGDRKEDHVEFQQYNSVIFDLSKSQYVLDEGPGFYKVSARMNGATKEILLNKVSGGNTEELGTLKKGNSGYSDAEYHEYVYHGWLELSSNDKLELKENSGSYGWLDWVKLEKVQDGEAESIWLEAEEATLNGSASIKDDGNRVELQRSDSITFTVPADIQEGMYTLFVSSNGNRTKLDVSVDGTSTGQVDSLGTGLWDAWDCEEKQMPDDIALRAGSTITLTDPSDANGGGYGHVDYIRLVRTGDLPVIAPFLQTVGAVTVKAPGEVLNPDHITLKTGTPDSALADRIRESLAAQNLQSEFYDFWLEDQTTGTKVNLATADPDGQVEAAITVPDGYPQSGCELYYLDEQGQPQSAASLVKEEAAGKMTFRLTDHEIWILAAPIKLQYEAENYYAQTTDGGRSADLQPEGSITVSLSDNGYFTAGNYKLTVSANGNRTRLMIKVNGIPVGMLEKPGSDFTSDALAEYPFGKVLSLQPEDQVTIYAPGAAGQGPYGWVDYLRLEPTEETPQADPEAKDSITYEAEAYWPEKDEGAPAEVANINNPAKKLEIPLLAADGLAEGDYQFFMRTTGTMRSYEVSINGTKVLSGTRDGSGFGMEYMTQETGSELIHVKPNDILTVQFPQQESDNWGNWVDWIQLVKAKPYEATENGVTVQAEIGVVPSEAELMVTPLASEDNAKVLAILGLDDSQADRIRFYDVSLLLNNAEIQPSGTLKIKLPIPEDFDPAAISVYHVAEDGVTEKISHTVADGYAVFETDHLSWYGIVGAPVAESLFYQAEDYYARTTDGGKCADLQPGEELTFAVNDISGFTDGTYKLTFRGCGTRARMMVKVNGVPVGMTQVETSDWGDMRTGAMEQVLSLKAGDKVTVYAPGVADAGPFGWVDYVQLTKTSETAPETPEPKRKVRLEAEDYWPEIDEGVPAEVANINNPAKKLEIPILASDGIGEDDYQLTVYTTGTMKQFKVFVNGAEVASETRDGSGYGMSYMVKEVVSVMIHVKPGDILTIQFPEQEQDNYGNWVDCIVLNKNRRMTGNTIQDRVGGRITNEAAAALKQSRNSVKKTYTEDGRLYYRAQAYYPKQHSDPIGDLQPGEQILFPVSDNGSFKDGEYTLTVRSCGNRESFVVKVNGVKVGSISRKETGYGMNEMTEDLMGGTVALKDGDILAVEGQTGGKYGWVDYVMLTPKARHEEEAQKKHFTWEAENYYQKQKDTPTADLQPGEQIVIPLSDGGSFESGYYYIGARSNGPRTALYVSINGAFAGSITRNATNYSMEAMSLDIMARPVYLTPQDTVSLQSPGEINSADGPWGWVDKLELIPVPASNPQELEEYRYPAAAYYKASQYLAAADLQAGDSISFTMSDQRAFAEGSYRLGILSNGTRERFDVRINGRAVGSISRTKSDYGDNGLTLDLLTQQVYLKPEDVVTITGQTGDFFGWVESLVLLPVR